MYTYLLGTKYMFNYNTTLLSIWYLKVLTQNYAFLYCRTHCWFHQVFYIYFFFFCCCLFRKLVLLLRSFMRKCLFPHAALSHFFLNSSRTSTKEVDSSTSDDHLVIWYFVCFQNFLFSFLRNVFVNLNFALNSFEEIRIN